MPTPDYNGMHTFTGKIVGTGKPDGDFLLLPPLFRGWQKILDDRNAPLDLVSSFFSVKQKHKGT